MERLYRTAHGWKRLCNYIAADLGNFFDKLHYYTLYKNNPDNGSFDADFLNDNAIYTIESDQHDEIVREFLTMEQECGGIKLVYRDSQDEYATEVMEAIQNGYISLIEGGVGTGKTYGYLLPIGMTMKKSRDFKKVIIAAPTIALQEQLMKDIPRIEKMLGMKIKAGIAKGINNYACINKIERELLSPKIDPEVSKKLMRLKREILEKESSDKTDLMKLSKEVWDKVKLSSRGACSNCAYSLNCPYYKLSDDLTSYNLIVTNHGNYIKNVLDGTDLVKGVDAVVIDEVHQFYDNILSIREDSLSLDNINKLLDDISSILPKYGLKALRLSISKIFARARASGSANFFSMSEKRNLKENYSIVDSNRLRFDITKTVAEWLDIAIEQIANLLEVMTRAYSIYSSKADNTRDSYIYKASSKNAGRIKELKKEIEKIYNIFKDMRASYSTSRKRNLRDTKSKNIYWAYFYENNKIIIRYTPKNNFDLLNKIFSSNIPYVLTSATMGNYYTVEKEKLSAEEIEQLSDEEKAKLVNGERVKLSDKDPFKPIVSSLMLKDIDRAKDVRYAEVFSPYEYDNQVSFYYDPNMPVPNESDKYIEELALKIDEAIRITEGKALVLFTSKKTKYRVYKYMIEHYKYSFNLLLHEDDNANEVKEKFTNDINSCLFATGTFWEGIDIKGPALSNLIITHLPFDQVDAVNEYQASKYETDREKMQEVYIPKMLLKFKQGFGRLIRSSEDRGIFVCLDPRISKYIPEIVETTQVSKHNIRTNIMYPKMFYKFVIEPRIRGLSQQELDSLWQQYNLFEVELMEINDETKEGIPKGK